MVLAGFVLGAIGLVGLMSKRTLMGMMVSVQIIVMGASLLLAVAGVSSGKDIDGQIFGLFVALLGIAQLTVGYSMSVRLFYLKNRVDVETLENLKH